jgi:serine/threonine-protein kinase
MPIARQIAEALECAHEHGIVHRDLKPANVKVKDDGTVKVLDFGLAKAAEPVGVARLANSPTFTSPAMTERGMILGTAAYMAPEQARGKPVDHRADIWAFGVIVFEMLTGRQLFAGETVSDTLAAVLREEIRWPELPPIPAPLRRLLERCLQKDPKRRLHSIGDALLDLDDAIAAPAPAASGPVASVNPWPARLGWMAAAIAGSVALWLSIAGSRAPAREARWERFTQVTDTEGEETEPSISPDGKSIAYASRVRGSWDVYVQRIGGRNPLVVAGDPDRDESAPAFSPDGQTIAYNEAQGTGGIFVAGATGESSRRLTDFGFDPTWSPDGRHIAFDTERISNPYTRLSTSGLWVVDLAGGPPRKLDEGDAAQPAWSPSGARIAFWSVHGGQRDLYTIPAAGGSRVAVLEDAPLDWSPAWAPDGRFLYFASDRGGSMNIWRIAIDERSGRAAGAPEAVTAGVQSSIARPSFSADGSRLAFRSRTESVNPVALPFDPVTGRTGTPVVLGSHTGTLVPTDVSRDGRRLLFTNLGERQEDVFISASDGTGLRRVTDDVARDRMPTWMPDGRILFYSNRGGRWEAWSIGADGGGLQPFAAMRDRDVIFPVLSPTADRLVATIIEDGRQRLRCFIAPVRGAPSAAWTELPDAHTATATFVAKDWSPDGRRIAGFLITQDAGTQAGVGVYDTASAKVTALTTDRTVSVRWLPDGRRLVYFDEDRSRLVVVDAGSGQRIATRLTLPLVPSMAAFALAPDARTIYYGGIKSEADIWLVEKK